MISVHKLAGKLAGKVGGQYTNFSVHFKCKIWFMVSTVHQTVKYFRKMSKSHLTTGVWGSSSELLPKGTNSFHVLPSYVICYSDHNSALSCVDVLWCALSRVDVIWWQARQGLYDIHIMARASGRDSRQTGTLHAGVHSTSVQYVFLYFSSLFI